MSDVTSNNSTSEMAFIAKEVKDLPIILAESQIPKMKKKKDEAICRVVEKYQGVFGKEMDAKVFLKKVNNMKTRLKKKTDSNQTGNKRIKLANWEKNMLSAVQGETNAVFKKIEGALQFGTNNKEPFSSYLDFGKHISKTTFETTDQQNVSADKGPARRPSSITKYETEETKNLTTKELQRFVSLQQYKCLTNGILQTEN